MYLCDSPEMSGSLCSGVAAEVWFAECFNNCAANKCLWFVWVRLAVWCELVIQMGMPLPWLAAAFSSVSCRQVCLCPSPLLHISAVKSKMGAPEGVKQRMCSEEEQHILPLEAWVYTGCLTQYSVLLHTYGVTRVRWTTGPILQGCSFPVTLKLLLQLLVGILLALGSLECVRGDYSPHYGYVQGMGMVLQVAA